MNVSIVIPCYNVENYIRECVISCRNQTFQDIEIICIDNNSTDDTAKELAVLKHEFGITFLTEKTPGACAARNKGLHNATSKYVQFLDADDLLLPSKIETQVNYLEEENAHFIVSNYLYQTINGENLKKIVHKDVVKGLYSSRLGITSANLFKTESVKSVSGWDERLSSSQEYDLMFRLLKKNYKPIICANYDTIVREREGGAITQSDPVNKWRSYIKLRIEIFSWLKENQPSYFYSESKFYSNKLFEYIQILHTHDRSEALKIWLFYKTKFKIQPTSSLKKILVKVVGFDTYSNLVKSFKR
jgi:glycosyltransferase involved in cell wall biosynthesis